MATLRGEAVNAGDVAVMAVGGGSTIAIFCSGGPSSGIGQAGPGQAAFFSCANDSPNDLAAVEIQGGNNEALKAKSFGVGVHALSGTNSGVLAESDSGIGLHARSRTHLGVVAESDSSHAVMATTAGLDRSAVFASNNGQGDVPAGVSPESGNGVVGLTVVNGGAGVFGANNGTKGRGVQGNGPEVGVGGFSFAGNGVLAQSETGIAILAQGPRAGRFQGDVEVTGTLKVDGPRAGRFQGDVEVTGTLKVDRDISVTGDVFLANRDVAEQFEVDSTAHCEPGMLMVIGENGALAPCTSAYDKRAIGIISGAGTLKPAITLGQSDGSIPTVAIAVLGTVFCRADADKSPINVGDLLTSSDTLGHAMKAGDLLKGFGAVIGKALAPLHRGQGLLPILIALQ